MPVKEKVPMKSAKAGGGGPTVLDFSGVKLLEPLDDTKNPYLIRISKMTEGTAKRSGEGKVSVEFTVVAPEKFKNRKLFREYSKQPQALFGLHGLLKACGEDDLGADFVLIPDNYIGTEVAVWVRNEPWEDQIRSRITRIASASRYQAVEA